MSYAGWREEFRRCLLDAISICGEFLSSNGRAPNTVTGVCLDVFPWFRTACVALRLSTDGVDQKYTPGEWELYEDLSDATVNAMASAAAIAGDAYANRRGTMSRIEMANLIFMAAADALLDSSTYSALESIGFQVQRLPACDEIETTAFDLIVVDPDQTVAANYCEIHRTHRNKQRLVSNWV